MRLIWLSDLHFQADGDVYGHDPRVRLDAAISHINAHLGDADFCVISGDMANHGKASDYKALSERLRGLAVPYYPMAGNHDDRGLLAEHLEVPDDRLDGFIQYRVDAGDAMIIAVDTQTIGSHAGEVCAARLEWLDDALRSARDRNVILFMHHPPMPVGLLMQDTDKFENGDKVLDLLQRHSCVKYLCLGHVHRQITGTVKGIPFATMGSVLYQAPSPQPPWTWETFAPPREAPMLGVVTLDGLGINIQYRQICTYETGIVTE